LGKVTNRNRRYKQHLPRGNSEKDKSQGEITQVQQKQPVAQGKGKDTEKLFERKFGLKHS
jgi:hypothetical protein